MAAVGDITQYRAIGASGEEDGFRRIACRTGMAEAGEVRTAGRQVPMGAGAPMAVGKLLMAVGELPMAVRKLPMAVGKLPMEVGAITAMAGLIHSHRIRSPS